MDGAVLVIFLAVLASIACAGFGVRAGVGGGRARMEKRLDAVRRRSAKDGETRRSAANVRLEDASTMPGFEVWLKRMVPHHAALKGRLEGTGRRIPLATYALANAALAATVFVAATGFLGLPAALGAPVALGSGLGVPWLVVGRLTAIRLERFAALFPEAIDLIVRGLRSGLPVPESVAAVGRELPDPLGREFRQITESVRLGRSLEQAFWDSAEKLKLPEFRFFVVSIAVQRETGGNLAETLANLSDILRRRRQMRLKVRALSAEARISAYMLGGLPFFMFAILMLLNRDYEMTLLTDPRGHAMIAAGLATLAAGIAVMWRMVRFEI